MAEDFTVNVDFAVLRGEDGETRALLAWGDRVRVVDRTSTRVEVEVTDFRERSDGTVEPVTTSGYLKRKVKGRQVAVPSADARVLHVAFVDVQQGDGVLVQTPDGRFLTIDGGENQLFARYLAGRFRGTSASNRQPIAAMIVTHGDADHFAGLADVHESETAPKLSVRKRVFVQPERVFHNGLVKRPSSRPELEQLGPTKKVGSRTVVTGLVDNPLDVPASDMNKHFVAWRKALEGWASAAPIEYRRLARGSDDAFDFLAEEGIAVEVLGPVETKVGPTSGLAFLPEPKKGKPLVHLDFEAGALSASHTINGHSIVLRVQYGNVRLLFAGDLNNAAEEALVADHLAGGVDLQAEVLKVPHHGSHEFTPGFLQAVSPVVSVVSSGDETSRTEYIHPRATLMSALGRYGRDDASVVFVTEMVAFFEMAGWVAASPPTSRSKPFFGFRRTAYGLVRVRTDGERLLVFSDTGKRDVKEAYAYDVPAVGTLTPSPLVRA